MIIVLKRMQYLVRRWHSGKRIVEQRSTKLVGRRQGAQFQVGQPVSSQNFATATRPVETKSVLTDTWLGTSPPTKEKIKRQPLISPGLLSKYVERFGQIQDTLGLDSGQ